MNQPKSRPTIPEGILPDWKTCAEELNACVRGYPKLAREMERVPEISIFRRFAALNARSLLYFQQELIDMESRLKQLEYRDSLSEKGWRKAYAQDAACLQDSVASDDPAQWTLVLQIREKLKQYNKALVYQSILCKLPRPDRYDLNDIRSFIYSSKCNGMSDPFVGKDSDTWGTPTIPNTQAADLITLKARKKEDRFSNFIAERAIRYIKWPLKVFQPKKKRMDGLVVYHDGTVMKITYVVIGVLASLAPILSIYVLTTLHTMKARLWTIAAFNVGIALSLQLFTEAKRTDIFSVTAAFAAVQVVFVGQALDDGPKEMMFPAGYVLNTTCNR